MTDLDIDYPDNYELIVTHENGNTGTLNINVASQYAVRNLEVYGQQCYLRWGGTPDSLSIFDEQITGIKPVSLYNEVESINKKNKTIIEDAYEHELRSFFLAIEKKKEPKYSFAKDKSVLKLIDCLEGDL